ncbi:MAG TPA: cytochrome c3 family protein [Pseudomonadales bacterium]
MLNILPESGASAGRALTRKCTGRAAFALVALLTATAVLAADAPCGACHEKAAADYAATPHGAALGGDCDSCHGDGAAHLSSPSAATIRTFSSEPPAEQNAVCTACHQESSLTASSAHSAAGMACSSCHSVHGKKKVAALPAGFERVGEDSSLCFDCHQDVFSQFAFNERHRLAEGAVDCTSCHDPHSPRHGMMLGGFDNDTCADCHADLTGPFVFEHAASRIDGCSACHEPHGSPNRHMLKFQAVGAQCYSCHAEVAQFHLGFGPSGPPRFSEQTVCTNCHVTIHGSNLDPLFLR